jgi:nucleotide-binding universal stress UspA family protein
MRNKILLPTDFSNNSWHAINYALKLYKNDSCDFYILNVFSATSNILDSLLNMEPGSELYESGKARSENGLAKLLDKLTIKGYNNTKHHFSAISKFNNVIEAIKNVVEEKDIEMIIMGNKGETGSRRVVFGSTAVYVMEKARNCPVMVVPELATLTLPKEIVFPTSYRTHYKRRELRYLINIAKKCNATIAILHISEENKLDKNQLEHKKMLEEIFEDVAYSFHELSNFSVESAVNIFIESRESDMVAFINKKHPFFGSMLTNPMVKGIAFHSKVPILVMHDLRN